MRKLVADQGRNQLSVFEMPLTTLMKAAALTTSKEEPILGLIARIMKASDASPRTLVVNPLPAAPS